MLGIIGHGRHWDATDERPLRLGRGGRRNSGTGRKGQHVGWVFGSVLSKQFAGYDGYTWGQGDQMMAHGQHPLEIFDDEHGRDDTWATTGCSKKPS